MVLPVGSCSKLSDKQGRVWPSFCSRRAELSIVCEGCGVCFVSCALRLLPVENIRGEEKGLEVSYPVKERLECAERCAKIVGLEISKLFSLILSSDQVSGVE